MTVSIALYMMFFSAPCHWVEDPRFIKQWREDYICGERVAGRLGNRQTYTGEPSTYWLAEVPMGKIIGTFTNKEAARKAVERTAQ